MKNSLSNVEIDFCFLSTLLYLKEEKSKCDAYDGYSVEDQTEYYVKSNGFNPVEKYVSYLKLFRDNYDLLLTDKAKELLTLPFSMPSIQKFGIELENIFSDYPNKDLIIKIYLDLYINITKGKETVE